MTLPSRLLRAFLNAVAVSAALVAAPGGTQSIDHRYNGMWYQPALAGHGFNLVMEADATSGLTVFVTFFTYDDDGRANFYAGNVGVPGWSIGESLTVPLQQTSGSTFSDPRAIAFQDPAEFTPAGGVTLRLSSCGHGEVAFQLTERTSGLDVGDTYPIEKLIGAPLSECRAGQPRGSLERLAFVTELEGGYRYAIHVPAEQDPPAPLPLLVIMHGAAGPGQAASQARGLRDLWAPLAEEEGFIVLSQVGTSPNGSWFVDRATAIQRQLIEEVSADYAVDTGRIYAWGFSAGGHVLHDIVLNDTGHFAGYAVNAGALEAVFGRQNLDQVPRFIPFSARVGQADPLLDELRADRDAFLVEGWLLGETLSYGEFDGGHEVRAEQLMQHWSFLSERRLPGAETRPN